MTNIISEESKQQPESSEAPSDNALASVAESLAQSIVDGINNKASVKESQIAELQDANTELRDTLNEHRFWSIFVAVVVFDAFAFSYLSSIESILLFLLEIIPLTFAAKKYGFESVAEMLDTIAAWAIKIKRDTE